MDWQDVKKALLITSAYFGRDLPEAILKMQVEDIKSFCNEPARVLAALTEYRLKTKQNRPPLPSDLLRILKPEIDPDKAGNEIASRIFKAISLFGYTTPGEAKKYLGDEVWELVIRFGGWSYICQNLGTNRLPNSTFFAQIRDTAKSLEPGELQNAVKHLTGRGQKQIQSSRKNEVLELTNSIIKNME